MADPNGAAKNKDEARVARIMRVELNGQLDRIMAALGDPPDLNRLDLEFWTEEQQALIRALRPEIERMVVAGAQTTFDLLPLQFDWALAAQDAIGFAQTYTFELVTGLDRTSQRTLQRKVADYIENPTTIGELRKSLIPTFGKTRANTIAVTEVTRAYAEGEQIAAAQAEAEGLKLTPIWNTSEDELVCPLCGPLNGKPKVVWAQLVPGTTWPPQHPRCRCWPTHAWDEPVLEAVPEVTTQTAGVPNAT